MTAADAGGLAVTETFTVTVDDFVEGAASINVLTGTSGDDALQGLAGSDTLTGGDGADVLYGGTGADRLEGEGGDDVYRFNRGDGADFIHDEYRYDDTVTYDFSYDRQIDDSWTENRQGHYTTTSYSYDGEGNVIGSTTHHHYPNYTVTQHGTQTETVNATADYTEEVQGDGGNDVLEFGAGIDVGDIVLHAAGDDLLVGVQSIGSDTISDLTDCNPSEGLVLR